MNLYFDKKRIAFVVLSLLSCLFALICVFSNGWSTYDGEQFGLFSPDIASNNVCGRLAKNDEKCLRKCLHFEVQVLDFADQVNTLTARYFAMIQACFHSSQWLSSLLEGF